MAYEVTATRKRPQNFDEMVGQDFIVSTLKNAKLGGDTVKHLRPQGSGKNFCGPDFGQGVELRAGTHRTTLWAVRFLY